MKLFIFKTKFIIFLTGLFQYGMKCTFASEDLRKNTIIIERDQTCSMEEWEKSIHSIVQFSSSDWLTGLNSDDPFRENPVSFRVDLDSISVKQQGSASSRSVYNLNDALGPQRSEAYHRPCAIVINTLHHMDMTILDTTACGENINAERIKDLAIQYKCVASASFDRFASPEFYGSHFELPNDPYFGEGHQWYLTGMNGIDATETWPKLSRESLENPGVVGILDLGFDMEHEDLKHSWWRNISEGDSEWPDNCEDGVDNDGNGYTDDCYGYAFDMITGDRRAFLGPHGTSVASLCCAQTNNRLGLASIGWNVVPMPLRIDGRYSLFVEALNYAQDKNVKVINISLGGPASEFVYNGLKRLENVSVIIAAGNQHCDLAKLDKKGCYNELREPKGYPGGYSVHLDNLITVGASDLYGRLSHFSNYDTSENHLGSQILAPGVDLIACSGPEHHGKVYAPGKPITTPAYTVVSGTSYAAPIVAAIVAIIRSRYPKIPARAIRKILLKSCRSYIMTDNSEHSGCSGVINASRALRYAKKYNFKMKLPSIPFQ